MSSTSVPQARSSLQHPKELDEGSKVAGSNLNNVEQKAVLKSDLKITGLIRGLIITSLPHYVPDDEIQCECIMSPSMKARVLNAPGYPARIPKPRRAGLYTVGSTPDMGNGLFAARDIKRGELIVAERPLILEVPEPPGAVINKSSVDPQILGEYENLLEAAVARLPLESQDDFKALHDNRGDLLGKTDSEFDAFLDAAGLPPMSRAEFGSLSKGDELFRISRSNRYAFTQLHDDFDTEAKYGAVCKIASRINHSCTPNVLRYTKLSSLSVQFYAFRDIKAGEQLFSSYCKNEVSNRSQRQAILVLYSFICKCPACVHATPETDRLRDTFINQIDRFKSALSERRGPSDLPVLLKNALTLEEDMLKEGLDSCSKFGTLLQVICLAFANLKKGPESQTYLSLVLEFRISLKEDEA